MIAYENHPSDYRISEMGEICSTVRARWGTGGGNIPLVQSIGFTQCDAARDVGMDVSPTLRSGGNGGYPSHSVAYGFEPGIAKREGNPNRFNVEMSPTLRAQMGDNQVSMANNMAVRRLTPVECERLQGFPDNYTNIKDKCPDGPRYKAMGNSMAVPVMRWIGKRIQMVENNEL